MDMGHRNILLIYIMLVNVIEVIEKQRKNSSLILFSSAPATFTLNRRYYP